MKTLIFLAALLLAPCASAQTEEVLSPQQLQSRVAEINSAQNKVMMRGSTAADVEALFAHYTEDFVYEHEVYGGEYPRAQLYSNTVRYVESGGYNRTDDRYTVLNTIAGHNAIAVERRENADGSSKNHLAIFEFRGDKVSRIIEYWK